MCLQHISDRRLQRRSPLCCPASDWQAAAGCLSAAPSTWSLPAATEGNTPGRRSSPPHRTPPSPPPSPNLTERQRRRKNRNIFRSLSSVQKSTLSEQQVLTHKHKILTIISFTVIINTVTNVSEKQRKLQLHRQPAECAVLLPAAPNNQTEELSVLLHIYILSLSLYYRRSETCRNIKKKVSIINRRQWTIYDVPIISDVQ